MKAAVLERIGEIRVKEVPDPVPEPGGLVINVDSCGICSTDIKMWRRGQRDLRCPRILGHEVVGTVVDSRSECYSVGDRVQVYPGVVCGECHYCRTGRENLCTGIRIIGFSYDGGFAELMEVPAGSVICGGVNRLPENLSSVIATLAEPLACCLNCMGKLGVSRDDTVVVLGAGTMGLLNAALAKLSGARVVVSEVLDERIAYAAKTGADRVVNPSEEDLVEVVMEESGGRGADVIIPAFGGATSSYDLIGMLAKGGRLCMFSGIPGDQSRREIDLNSVHYEEKLIVGAYGCTPGQNRRAIELLSGELNLGWLPTELIALEQIEEGMRSHEQQSLRVVMRNSL
ncbi:MAG: alcohol dehydrogenase catalytic domain-containing protein [Candidatus Methanosuratincola sp.]